MSTHRQIQTKIWCDKDVLSSSTNGKLLFLYLICNKHINNSGVYEIPLSTIAHDLKLPAATIKKLLKTGLKNIHYDFKNEMVFVTNILRYYDNGDITNKLFNSLVTRDETAFCNDFYLNEKQIYEMVKGGHEIGGHGFVSSPLTTIPNQKNDIIQSLDYVKKFYNENIVFSYPNGDYNHDTLDILKDYGCKYAFTTVKQKLNINTSMLEIPRYDASQDLTI